MIKRIEEENKRLREAVEWALENGNFRGMTQGGDMNDRSNYEINEWWKAELHRMTKEGKG